MKLVENPDKVGRILAIIVVITIPIGAASIFGSFLNASGSQSTAMNDLIMYACEAVILICFGLAIALGIANRSYRNKLQSSESQNMPVSTDNDSSRLNATVGVDGTSESVSPETNIPKK